MHLKCQLFVLQHLVTVQLFVVNGFLSLLFVFRIHASLASWFYVLQVIILVLVFVVNQISFYLTFLCGYNKLVDYKQQFIVFVGQYRFLGIPIMLFCHKFVVSSCYYFTNVMCSRLVLYVQGSTFMGILYVGLQYVFAKIMSNFCTMFISVFNCLQFHNFAGFFVILLKNPLWA